MDPADTSTLSGSGQGRGHQPRHRTSRTEDLVFVLFTFSIMVGLCLDGWAHRHRPELETFFTPWHAVFYAGFTVAAAYLAFIVMRRRAISVSLTEAIPSGYELSVVGLGLFAIGGVGDGIWHTIWGIETSIDALLSPTHLLMLTAMSMAAAAPIRSAWRDWSGDQSPTLSSLLAVIMSTALFATQFAFFFLYANGFSNWPMQIVYQPGESDVVAALGVLSTLTSTVILVGAVMLLLRRWDTPPGTFTIIFTVVGVFMSGLDAFDYWWQILAPVAGGVTADVVMIIGSNRTSRWRAGVAGIVVPLVMWSVSTVALDSAWGVHWPPELWVGQIVMAMMAGYGLSLISHPNMSDREAPPR